MLIKLANYFNCSVDYLLGLTDITTPLYKNRLSQNEIKDIEIINKYNNLSAEDKKCFDKFLSFLSTNGKE